MKIDDMKLLHLIRSVSPTYGGPVEGILRQDQATSHLGTREVACLDAPGSPFLEDFPLKVYALGNKNPKGLPNIVGRHGYSTNYISWLKKNVHNYDAVIVNGIWDFSASGASLILPKCNVPYFVFTHGMLDPWFRKTFPLKHFGKQMSWFIFQGPLLKSAESVFFTCEEERLMARGQFIGQRYTETVVGYGTNSPPDKQETQDSALYQQVPELAGKRFLVFLGRIHVKKGCDLLIEAFARISNSCPDLFILIAGPDDSNLSSKLKLLATRLGVEDKIIWSGPLYGDAKWGAMRLAEAFVLPSHQENFGIAVAEALACGTPVLISNKVNIWREIKTASAGIVGDDTIEGTEMVIRNWLQLTSGEREAMKMAATKVFNDNFNMSITAPSMMKVIFDAVKATA